MQAQAGEEMVVGSRAAAGPPRRDRGGAPGSPAFASAGTTPHGGLRALRRSGAGRTAPAWDRGLAPGRDEAAIVEGRLDAQLGAGGDESVLDPGRVVAARQPRAGELELERDRFE
jgi:hypothetical protein